MVLCAADLRAIEPRTAPSVGVRTPRRLALWPEHQRRVPRGDGRVGRAPRAAADVAHRVPELAATRRPDDLAERRARRPVGPSGGAVAPRSRSSRSGTALRASTTRRVRTLRAPGPRSTTSRAQHGSTGTRAPRSVLLTQRLQLVQRLLQHTLTHHLLTPMAGEDLYCVFPTHRGAVDDRCRYGWRAPGPRIEADCTEEVIHR